MSKASFYGGRGVTPNNLDVDPVEPNNINAIEDSKNAAAISEANAESHKNTAAQHASDANTAKLAAQASEAGAETARTGAETAETAAASSATAAAASLAAIGNSEAAAAASAAAAATSATGAQGSATIANTERVAAGASAYAADTSRVAAQAAQTAAETAQTAAETAETNAATSASNAATSESNAASSASAAASSSAAASTSETNASNSATSASTSAATATTKAGEASTSAAAAATSAASSATSATASATSASDAASSATAAAASQVAAAQSAASAANTYDLFDDRYLGSKSTEPTVDNDGNALVQGSLYFNTTANEMRVYDGGNWIAASSAGGASLLEYFYTATANQTTFSGADSEGNTLSYTVDNILVIFNGVVLDPTADYTATDGSSIVMTAAAALDDEVHIIAFNSFTTADMVSKTNGGIFHGNVDFSNGIDVTGSITVTGTVDGVDVGQFKSDYDSHNHDSRYYTEAEADSRFVNVTGDTMTGNLTVDGTVTADGLTVDGTSNANGSINLYAQTDGNDALRFYDDDALLTGGLYTYSGDFNVQSYNSQDINISSASNVLFKTNSSERMRIDSSGNVDIGSTGGGVKLAVAGAVGPQNGTAASPTHTFYSDTNTGMFRAAVDTLGFSTAGTEAMRIDSSGNLLVGKTTTSGTVDGVTTYSSGAIEIVRTSNPLLYLNQQGSDREIIKFRKDNADIGAVKAVTGGGQTDIMVGSDATALWFGTGTSLPDSIVPASITGGGTRDNAVNLGYSNSRFKDLYLSGGVYLGGTGSANKLDDYEEGTFSCTVTYSGGGTASLSENGGSYVKIGRLVFVTIEIDISNTNSGSGGVFIGGLPFTVQDILYPTGNEGNGPVSYFNGFSTAVANLGVSAVDGTTRLDLYGSTSAPATSNTNILAGQMGTGEIRASCVYHTSA